jgi:hypothetical protein
MPMFAIIKVQVYHRVLDQQWQLTRSTLLETNERCASMTFKTLSRKPDNTCVGRQVGYNQEDIRKEEQDCNSARRNKEPLKHGETIDCSKTGLALRL